MWQSIQNSIEGGNAYEQRKMLVRGHLDPNMREASIAPVCLPLLRGLTMPSFVTEFAHCDGRHEDAC
jgi:hypothetical protein